MPAGDADRRRMLRAFAGEGAAPGSIDNLLERDEFDLVAVGRALLQDAQWAAKVLGNRFEELQPYGAAAPKTLS